MKIQTISLSLPLHMGTVNCFLINTGAGFVLIDTSSSHSRQELISILQDAGCQPGLIKLIIITHGDFDHTGNAAALRTQFDARIAMHPDDAAMLTQGDMFANRKQPSLLIRKLLPRLSGFGREEQCTPDLLVKDGDDLAEFGLEARIISIPGHSRGSIGILTTRGDLFCGDLLTNTDQPALNSIMDDLPAAHASLQKLGRLNIDTVFPGHGEPFPMRSLKIGVS